MRILFVEGNTDGTVGGSYYCLLDLLRRLDRTRYIPTVVFYREHPLLPEFSAVAETVVLQARKGYSFADKSQPLLRLLLRPWQRLANLLFVRIPTFFQFLSFAEQRRFALIHFNNGPCEPVWTLVARVLGIKTLAHLRGVPTRSGNPLWICRRCDQIVCVSRAIESILQKLHPSISKTLTIYDGFEAPEKVSSHRRTNEFVIGIVANIKRWKGQDTAIRALAELREMQPPIKMLFIGAVAEIADDQQYAQELITLVQSLELSKQVTFTGFRTDIEKLISSLNLLILPSTAPEPFGRVILEAMALGVPVIASAHGGPVEIITDQVSGLLFPPGDFLALAEAIRQIVATPPLVTQLTEAAHQTLIKQFSPSNTATQFSAIYDQLVCNRAEQ